MNFNEGTPLNPHMQVEGLHEATQWRHMIASFRYNVASRNFGVFETLIL
jgi:hypothetical protein